MNLLYEKHIWKVKSNHVILPQTDIQCAVIINSAGHSDESQFGIA